MPHQAVDPILAAAQVISALQSVVSRNVPPLHTAVVSVTMVHGGDAFNVIPPDVRLQGTIRTFDPGVRRMVLERFEQVVNGTAQALGCRAEINLQSLTPAVINDPNLAQHVQAVARQLLPQADLDTQQITMGSEDMSFMMQEIPGCFFFVGSANAERGLNAAHHHPRFDFDERALPWAAALMTSAAMQYLRENRDE